MPRLRSALPRVLKFNKFNLNEPNSTISGHFDGIKSLTELSETFNGNEGDLSTSQSEMCDNCGIDRYRIALGKHQDSAKKLYRAFIEK